jgi:hypothetical protein
MQLLEFGPEIRRIDIVDESDVEMARSKALETVLDRPHGRVVSVIQNQSERRYVDASPSVHRLS